MSTKMTSQSIGVADASKHPSPVTDTEQVMRFLTDLVRGRVLSIGRAEIIPPIQCVIVISLLGHELHTHGPSSMDHYAFAITAALTPLRLSSSLESYEVIPENIRMTP